MPCRPMLGVFVRVKAPIRLGKVENARGNRKVDLQLTATDDLTFEQVAKNQVDWLRVQHPPASSAHG